MLGAFCNKQVPWVIPSHLTRNFGVLVRIAALVVPLVFLNDSNSFGQDRSLDIPSEAKEFIDQFGDISTSVRKFAVAGTIESPNLRMRSDSDAIGTISDFIIVSDQKQKFRRQSARRELIDDGQLKILNWFTRIREGSSIRVGYDESGLTAVESIKAVNLPDFEPWDLSIASTSDFKADRVTPGYFLMMCDTRQIVSIEESLGKKRMVFQVGPKTRLFLTIDDDRNLPVYAQWRVSDSTITENPDEVDIESYRMIVSDVTCNWTGVDEKIVVPTEVVLRRLNSLQGANQEPKEVIVINMKWCIGKKMDSLALDSESNELYESIQQNAIATEVSGKRGSR